MGKRSEWGRGGEGGVLWARGEVEEGLRFGCGWDWRWVSEMGMGHEWGRGEVEEAGG